jgi:uncharacterized protein (TIGR02058 family)
MKRFIIELGWGFDLHGGDVTKAAKKAIADAMAHSCLAGLAEVLDDDERERIRIAVKIGCPKPEEVKQDEVLKALSFWKNPKIDEVVYGGLSTTGLHVDALGPGDQIVIAVASLTVYIE